MILEVRMKHMSHANYDKLNIISWENKTPATVRKNLKLGIIEVVRFSESELYDYKQKELKNIE